MNIIDKVAQLNSNKQRPCIGLALSGGVAYGLAHIGVLQYLEEIKMPIDIITGTSAGAIVGAFWAGKITSRKMYRVAKQTEWWFLAKPAAFKAGLMSSQGIETWFNRIIHKKNFADLDCTFAATATDFSTGELVILKSGNLATAVRISATIPGIYHPVEYEDRLMVDGGLVQNLPVQTCRDLGAEIVIGVDLHSNWIECKTPKTLVLSLIHAASILQRQHEIFQLQAVDVAIQPRVGGLSPINFKAVDEFVGLGYKAAVEAGDQLVHTIDKIIAKSSRN